MRKEGKDVLETVSNSDARFVKRIEFDSIPKVGTVLSMETGTSGAFECEVVRSDWHESKNIFVIACRYRKRSITPADYQTLLDSPDWELRPLI